MINDRHPKADGTDPLRPSPLIVSWARISRRLLDLIRGWGWVGLGYAIFVVVVFRGDFLASSGQWPMGTNALDASLQFWYLQHHPISMWLFPYTDWGQPFPGFTGPTVLSPAIGFVGPASLTRITEAVAFVAAGLSMFAVVRRLNGTPAASFAAGLFYMTSTETSQFFEGHIGAMVSMALAPAFFYTTFTLFDSPTFRRGVLAAVLLYLLASIGDMGILYFLLFFAIPTAAFAVVRRNLRQRYTLRDLLPLATSAVVLGVLGLSWAYPYALGARPLYTTNITVNILPFDQTTGENLALAFSGYVADNSFIHFTYGTRYYWDGGLLALPLFLLLPGLLTLYAFVTRRKEEILALMSAFVAIVFATGHLYPGFSTFNLLVFDYVPFFSAIPAVFRWVEYTLMVYAFLLGRGLSALERDLRAGAPWLRGLWAKLPQVRHAGVDYPRKPSRALATRRAGQLVAVTVVAVVALTMAQNVVVLTRPPGFFAYPAAYTAGFPVISDHPVYGEELMVPLGGIYDRAPWGGVSSSAATMAPYFTGADTVVFQAGTPYSLGLDQFIGNGIAFTLSRNMTKFLEAVNTQYIVTTNYSDWNYSSSIEYRPGLFYTAFENQTGIPNPIYTGSVQKVFALDNFAGNVSFHPTYFLTFGGQSMLYSVLDQPWYTGPGPVFVDGDNITSGLDLFVRHASLIIVSVSRLSTLPPEVAGEAAEANVPIIVIGDTPGTALAGPIAPVALGGTPGMAPPMRGNAQMPPTWNRDRGDVPSRSISDVGSSPPFRPTALPPNQPRSGGATMTTFPAAGAASKNPAIFSVYERFLQPQPSPTALTFAPDTGGWGIVLVSQTYSPLWSLTGGAAYHAVGNVGLNAWLVNTSVGAPWHASYAGDRFESTALVIEGGTGLGLLVVAAVVQLHPRSRKGRGAP